jgi:hypothetical protein
MRWRAATRSGKNCSPCWQRARSKVSLPRSTVTASPSRHSIVAPAGAACRRATASMAGLMSTASTFPAAPTSGATARATSPVPQARSSSACLARAQRSPRTWPSWAGISRVQKTIRTVRLDPAASPPSRPPWCMDRQNRGQSTATTVQIQGRRHPQEKSASIHVRDQQFRADPSGRTQPWPHAVASHRTRRHAQLPSPAAQAALSVRRRARYHIAQGHRSRARSALTCAAIRVEDSAIVPDSADPPALRPRGALVAQVRVCNSSASRHAGIGDL